MSDVELSVKSEDVGKKTNDYVRRSSTYTYAGSTIFKPNLETTRSNLANALLKSLHEDLFRRERFAKLLAAMFAVMGSSATIIANEICFDSRSLQFQNSEECYWKSLEWIGFIFMILVDLCIIHFYILHASRIKVEYKYASLFLVFRNTNLSGMLLLELAVCSFPPWPGLPSSSLWSHRSLPLTFFRLYLVVRSFYDFSELRLERELLVGPFRVTRDEYPRRSVFVILFNRHPFKVLSFLILASSLIGGYSIHVAERQQWLPADSTFGVNPWDHIIWSETLARGQIPDQTLYVQSPFTTLDRCVWFSIVTQTTLGYGEMIVVTQTGRFVASLLAVAGIMLTSLLVGSFSLLLKPSSFQESSLLLLKLKKASTKRRLLAAIMIQRCFRSHRLRKDLIRQKSVRLSSSPRSAAIELPNAAASPENSHLHAVSSTVSISNIQLSKAEKCWDVLTGGRLQACFLCFVVTLCGAK
jgi:hypothetical protein